jgi:hypothetical protein
MSDVVLSLDRQRVTADGIVNATGGPYTVSAAGTITVDSGDETAVRSDLGALVLEGTPTSQPDEFVHSMSGIDVSLTTKQQIFTVPAGKRAVVTRVVVRDASTSLSTATYNLGFDPTNADDVVSDPVTWDGNALAAVVATIANPVPLGQAGDVFGLKTVAQEGSPQTIVVDVFGYYI